MKIKNYELEQTNILKTLKIEDGNLEFYEKLNFIPTYLIERYVGKVTKLSYEEQLVQISCAVTQELKYYKSGNPKKHEENKILSKRKKSLWKSLNAFNLY